LAHFGLVGLTLDQFDSLWISLTHFGLVWLTLVLHVGLTLDQFWITLVQFGSLWFNLTHIGLSLYFNRPHVHYWKLALCWKIYWLTFVYMVKV